MSGIGRYIKGISEGSLRAGKVAQRGAKIAVAAWKGMSTGCLLYTSFLKDATEKEKKEWMDDWGYGERLHMICSGLRNQSNRLNR